MLGVRTKYSVQFKRFRDICAAHRTLFDLCHAHRAQEVSARDQHSVLRISHAHPTVVLVLVQLSNGLLQRRQQSTLPRVQVMNAQFLQFRHYTAPQIQFFLVRVHLCSHFLRFPLILAMFPFHLCLRLALTFVCDSNLFCKAFTVSKLSLPLSKHTLFALAFFPFFAKPFTLNKPLNLPFLFIFNL